MKYIFLPFTFIFLFSCAQEQKTNAKVSVRLASALNGEFAGSLILMGKHLQTNQTFFKQVGVNGVSVELDNGDWKFAAIGWEGDPDPATGGHFTGRSYCDVKPNISLSGGIVNLAFNATIAKCALPAFGGLDSADPTNGFKQLIVNSCIDIKRSLSTFGLQENSPEDKGCGVKADGVTLESGSERYIDGINQYFKITMYGTGPNGDPSLPISSRCISKLNLKTPNSNIRLPFSSSALPISYQINSFESDASCAGAPSSTYTFDHGFYQKEKYQNAYVHNDNNANIEDDKDTDKQMEIFLHEEGCNNESTQINAGTTSTFSYVHHPFGSPSKESEYLICNAGQLVFVGETNFFPNSDKANYHLGADLDITLDESIRPKDATNTDIPFQGNFYGDSHKVTGLTSSFFDIIKAESKSIEIRDILIQSATVGSINPQIIQGIFSNQAFAEEAKSLEIKNISIDETSSLVKSDSISNSTIFVLGGLIGTTNTSLNSDGIRIDSSYSKATINTTIPIGDHTVGASIGGFIGETHGEISISRSSFHGELILENLGSNNSVFSGGFVGIVAGADLDKVNFEKITVNISKLNNQYDYKQKLGGMVGKLEGLVELSIRDNLFIASNTTAGEFKILSDKFYAMIANLPLPATLKLTIDGYIANVSNIPSIKFNSYSEGYLIPSLTALSPGLILGTGAGGVQASLAIIHSGGLIDESYIGTTNPIYYKLKKFDNVGQILDGYFFDTPTWVLDPINEIVTLNLQD
jgi:hypothetical protein